MQKAEEIMDKNMDSEQRKKELMVALPGLYMAIVANCFLEVLFKKGLKKENSASFLNSEKIIKSILNAPLQDNQKEKLAELSEKELPKITWKDVAEYCLNECDSYQEFKVVYDMLVMFMGNMQDEEWLKTKQLLKKRKRQLGAGINIENAKEVVLEKNIECEINNIEEGGVGVSINKTTKKSKK